jgi:hypothetical protein
MNNAKYSWKYHGSFCSAVCSNGVIAMCYQQPLCFVFVFTGMGSSGYGNYFRGFYMEKKSWEMLLLRKQNGCLF